MKRSNKVGFTIIETVLFLAVTGLMISGIMIGVGSSISIQRFRDSVLSLQSFLQQQYSNVNFSINNRNVDYTCEGEYNPGGASNPSRGQSDCVILGKLIRSNGEKSIIVNSIIGKIPTTSTSNLDEIKIFNSTDGYSTYISDFDQETYDLSWQAFYKNPTFGALNFSVLIVKSPNTGIIHTFVSYNIVTDKDSIQTELINSIASGRNLKMCIINPDSTSLFEKRKAIVIMPDASGPSGVQTRKDNVGC